MDTNERKALRFALKGFIRRGLFFGSQLDEVRKGGDIDILLIPQREVNSLKLSFITDKILFKV